MWYSGAYTAQMDMVPVGVASCFSRPVIFDGAKRDRAIWSGDLLVTNPVALLSIGLPADVWNTQFAEEFYEGFFALAGRYDVTVYQMGFRLGGKGASGRGVSGRIEEHGLHLWMGYYENAFRLMRECYAELGRDPQACPIASFEQAFLPANENAAADYSPSGQWLLWNVEFPPLDGLPGDLPARSWSVADYLVRAAALVRTAAVVAPLKMPVRAVNLSHGEIDSGKQTTPSKTTAAPCSTVPPGANRWPTSRVTAISFRDWRRRSKGSSTATRWPSS